MPTQENIPPSRLITWVRDWLTREKREHPNIPATTAAPILERLAGDGSTRCFYRLTLPEMTRIVLYDPEWILSKDYPAHQAYLSARGVPVPRFYEVDAQAGCLVMEDLGDELLQNRLLREPKRKSYWLVKAAELLANLHGATFPVPSTLPVASRSFDKAKYSDELAFTFEHLHQRLLNLPPPSPAHLSKIGTFCGNLGLIQPCAFAHRDYHTRNILMFGERLVLIDFQDARMGPPHYDLASLLYDPYVPIPEEEKVILLDTYRQTLNGYPLARLIGEETFRADLALVAFQRVIKAAGSYASFFTRYGKSTHLPYLRPALQSARSLLEDLNQLGGTFAATAASLAGAFPLSLWMERIENLPAGKH